MRIEGKNYTFEVVVDESLDQALAIIRPRGEYTQRRLAEISRRLAERTHDPWTATRGHLLLTICAWISRSGMPCSTMAEDVASKYRALVEMIDGLFSEGSKERRGGRRRRRRKARRRARRRRKGAKKS